MLQVHPMRYVTPSPFYRASPLKSILADKMLKFSPVIVYQIGYFSHQFPLAFFGYILRRPTRQAPDSFLSYRAPMPAWVLLALLQPQRSAVYPIVAGRWSFSVWWGDYSGLSVRGL